MKLRIVLGVIVVAAVVYCSLPYYARQALIHWMPVIDVILRLSTGTLSGMIRIVCGTGRCRLTTTVVSFRNRTYIIWTACIRLPFW